MKISGDSVPYLVLDSGEKLYSWIDYDLGRKRLEVRLSKSGLIRPYDPSVSYSIDLSGMWKDEMFVGLSSLNENPNSTVPSSVYSWSFYLRRGVDFMHSEPLDPRAFLEERKRQEVRRRNDFVWSILTTLAFGVGCGAAVSVLVLFAWSMLVDRRSLAPMECPVHPVDFEYEKIVTVAVKDTDNGKKEVI